VPPSSASIRSPWSAAPKATTAHSGLCQNHQGPSAAPARRAGTAVQASPTAACAINDTWPTDGGSELGNVGTGFTTTVLTDLARRLAQASSPFTASAGDGILRHPFRRGYRPDKHPADVRPE
jgi:hypothetical protein